MKHLDFENTQQDLIGSIQLAQAEYFNEHGKYFMASYEVDGGYVDVHEYFGQSGAGYIIYLRSEGCIKATDFGPEGRSFEWREATDD